MNKLLYFFVGFLMWSGTAFGAAHYIDSSCTYNGTGHSGSCAASAGAAGAWNSFTSANSHSYAAGDDIYLKCGSTFTSQRLAPALFGDATDPQNIDYATIGAYYGTGTVGVQGARPIISGNNRTYPAEGSYTALVDITSGRDYVHITNLHVVGSGGIGINIAGTSTNQAIGNKVTDCYVASTYRHGIRLVSNVHYSTIDGNEVTDTGWSRFNSTYWPAAKMIYTEPCESEPCSQCKHRRYDSWHDELWCGHDPPPEDLTERLIIDQWGHCDYWESRESR